MSTATTLPYTDEVKVAIQIAQSIAKEYQNGTFSSPHLLKALMHKDVGLLNYMISKKKDVIYIEEWAEVRIEGYPKSSKIEPVIRGDEFIAVVMEEADNNRLKMGKDEIDPMAILAALATSGVGFTYDQLKTLTLSPAEIIADGAEGTSFQDAITPSTSNDSASGGDAKLNALTRFCSDKTALAKEGKLDAIIGRDKENRMIAEILGRRSKPNVIITGEPGVGKTALVDGFALNIVEGKVPSSLKNAIIFELDFGSLVAGASYKGEVEDRLKNIIKEVKQFEKAILFIDEIHTLMDKNGAAGGAAQLLKPELARGELTIIGATTLEEYRKYIEVDEAFSRRFEIIKVDQPDEITAARMLKMVLPYYEAHHQLKFADDAVLETVKLAKRYIKERMLPDAAIDLIDRTMSVVKMMGDTSQVELASLKEGLEVLKGTKETITDKEYNADLKWYYNELKNKVSHVLFSQIQDERDPEKMDSHQLSEYLDNTLEELLRHASNKKEIVDKFDVTSVIAHRTGIPVGKIQTQEKERLINMESFMRNRVVGQDHALKSVAEAILESRSGLNKPGQPIGSFFFLGPTGTGKTELAKALTEFLFADETAFIRFDMSEFKEEHSAALLYGAPPGYVGYEEGGMLVNKIREKPYSVVLFDEIEKAHKSVFDLFLQILDEGKLHDRLGKEGDFSNAVILFTSNIGSDYVVDKFNAGDIPGSNELMEIMQKYFRPEFLARLTEIVPFAPINEKNVLKIFEIKLSSLLKALKIQGIRLELTDRAKESLAKAGFTPKYGARPIEAIIRNQLRRPLSKMIITGEVSRGSIISIDIDGDGALIWNNSLELVEEIKN